MHNFVIFDVEPFTNWLLISQVTNETGRFGRFDLSDETFRDTFLNFTFKDFNEDEVLGVNRVLWVGVGSVILDDSCETIDVVLET